MKSTNELVNEIKEHKRTDIDFLTEKDYGCPKIEIYLAALMQEKNVQVKDLIRKLNLERTYGYQIFNGTRRPTRNILIRISILLELSLEETQRLLKIGNREILYPRVRDDAAAIFSIEKKLSLEEYVELLQTIDE